MPSHAYRRAMDFQVLGPLRAVAGGMDLEVRGLKERILLMHLVASVGRVVPSADLIDSLWPHDPPRTAAKSLQTYVLRLRNTLEPDRDGEPRLLVTAGAGYRLAATERDTDAGRFVQLTDLARRAVDGQRWQAALDAAEDGLALWRGPAYAGCEDTAFGPAEARRLGELRLLAQECRLEALLALGQESTAVADLERLVTEHPLRERLWELLMLASYRAGRQGDALDAFDRARALLAEELGVDPGPELRSLHARVLAQDPGLHPPRARVQLPDELRRSSSDLVGRDDDLGVLRGLWERTLAGSATAALVRGPVGAGASALASALAVEVAGAGHPVLLVDDPAPPSGPWLRVVEHAYAAREPGAMLLRLARPGTEPLDGETVLDLAPLDAEDVRRLVAAYAAPDEVDDLAQQVARSGPAWPGRVHSEAVRLTREAATRRLDAAVGVVEQTSARLVAARADVSDSIVRLAESEADRATERGVCPWRGLAAYDVGDAPWFAGREHLVAELLSRLASTRVLALVGASGSGKSSALRAGVLAALAADALPGSSAWRQVVLRPGRHPMRELARAALGTQGGDVGDVLARMLQADDEPPRTLVVVDQMEEVWTACGDEGERDAFLDTLTELVSDPRSTTSVVVALRADYVGDAAEHAGLAAMLADGTVLVGSPTSAEVRRAITRPAARAALHLEEGLADTLVSDAGDEPGLLPLLSVALTQVWAQREGDRLTFAGYVTTGGLRGAIATLAEDVWAGLDDAEQTGVRLLLLRLSGPGEGAGVVRRRVPMAEVDALAQPGLRRVVDRLAGTRLLTVGDGHVEVAHEALFREWPRLRGWLTDDAAGRAVQRRLALAASEWDAEGREPTGLWRGTRLQSGLEVAAARPDELTHVEADFLEEGRLALEAEEHAARLRAAATTRQNRRLRWLLVGTAVLLVLALVAGAVALAARTQAEDSADAARASALAADAKRLAADALNEDRPALALLGAVEATRRDRSPETYGALLTLLTRNQHAYTRLRIEDRFLRIASSADGTTVYLADNTSVLRAVDTLSAEVLWTARTSGGEGQWGDPVADPRGAWVAVPMFVAEPAVAILDAGTGRILRQVTAADLRAAEPDTSPWLDESLHLRGRDLVVSSSTHVFVVDATTGDVSASHPLPAHAPHSFAVGDGRVAFPEEPAHSLVVDAATGRTERRKGSVVGATPDGRRVMTIEVTTTASGAETSLLQVRDARWQPVGSPWRVAGYVRAAIFLPGGREVAVARDEELEIHDLEAGALARTMSGHSGALLQMELTGPDRDLIWTAGRDGNAVAFDLTGTRGVLRRLPHDIVADAGAGASGVAVVVNYYDTELNTFSVVDLATGEDRFGELQPVRSCLCQPAHAAITPDGRLGVVAVVEFTDDFEPVTDRGRVAVVDTTDGGIVRTIRTPWEASGLAVTPDGSRVLVNGSGGWALYDIASGEAVWTVEAAADTSWFPGGPQAAVAPDGSLMALGRGESVVVVAPETGEELVRRELPESVALSRLAFDGDSRTLAVGSASGHLRFLDTSTLEAVAPDRLVTASWVFDLQLSPDGRVLAVMGSDGDVTLYDTSTWRPYGKPVLDELGWGFLVFDDDRLRVYGEFGADHEVDIDPQAWVEAGCRSANTTLTAAESAVILPGEPVAPTCA